MALPPDCLFVGVAPVLAAPIVAKNDHLVVALLPDFTTQRIEVGTVMMNGPIQVMVGDYYVELGNGDAMILPLDLFFRLYDPPAPPPEPEAAGVPEPEAPA